MDRVKDSERDREWKRVKGGIESEREWKEG